MPLLRSLNRLHLSFLRPVQHKWRSADWAASPISRFLSLSKGPLDRLPLFSRLSRLSPFFPDFSAVQVSVIIPVYNAERFLRQAASSALEQPETTEVILVEDGSTDNSPEICKHLASEDPRVRVLHHPDGANLGAAASRNLGMVHASQEWIAFLDADDWFQPGRFTHTRHVAGQHANADGIYETVGAVFETDELRDAHLRRAYREMTGLMKTIRPEDLFHALAHGKQGHLHLDGFVIRKKAVTGDLLFDAELRQCQDSDWFLRLARKRRLYGGKIDTPVAIRRVHGGNRVLDHQVQTRYQRQYLKKCIDRQFYGSTDKYANAYLVARYVSWLWNGRLRRAGVLSRHLIIFTTCGYVLLHPAVLLKLIFPQRRTS